MRAIVFAALLPIVATACADVRAQAKPNLNNPGPETIDFCAIAHDPDKFDGHLVRTDIQFSTTEHAALLTSKACQSGTGQKNYAHPLWATDKEARNYRILIKLAKSDETADATVVGLVHAVAGQTYGYYDAPFEITIQGIEQVKADRDP